MKLTLRTLLAALLFAACAIPVTAARADVKIAVVDMGRVFTESKIGKAAQVQLKDQQASVQSDLKKEEQSLAALNDQLQKDQAAGKSGPDFDAKKADFQKRYAAFVQKARSKDGDLKKAEDEAVQKLRKQTGDVLNAIAQQDKINFILNRDAVLLGDENADITDRVIAQLDKGGATTPAGAPTAKAAK